MATTTSAACPACGADAGPAFCGDCGVPLKSGRVDDSPIPIGDSLRFLDFRSEPLPGQRERSGKLGTIRYEPSEGGVDIQVPEGRIGIFNEPSLRMREAVVRLSFTAHDASAKVGCVVRREVIDDGKLQLGFEMHPGSGCFRINRVFVLGGSSDNHSLVDWTRAPMPAVGQPVYAELRVRGPVLQGWIGQSFVVQVTDPVLQAGMCGLRVGTHGGDARMTLHAFDVCVAGGDL